MIIMHENVSPFICLSILDFRTSLQQSKYHRDEYQRSAFLSIFGHFLDAKKKI